MTVVLPLPHAGPSRPAQTRSFGDEEESYHVKVSLQEVVRAVRAAKRIVVVCGAGVSTAAKIPDFRSGHGLYSSSSEDKGRGRAGKEPSVQDLFHVKCLSDESLLPAHHALLNTLHQLATTARPTPFHDYLRQVNEQGRLLRCYTQNIDGLEEKAGLASGLPEPGSMSRRGKKRKACHLSVPHIPIDMTLPSPGPLDKDTGWSGEDEPKTPTQKRVMAYPTPPSSQRPSIESTPDTPPSPTPRSTPDTPRTDAPAVVPRVIPLHGTLMSSRCPVCAVSYPSSSALPPASPLFPLGDRLTPCPSCEHLSLLRSALSERSRPTGYLRPSIVLYGEDHPSGHLIGQVVERDLKGLGGRAAAVAAEGKIDFLIVAGTSLSIPGVKRLVKEMSKAARTRPGVRAVFVNDQPPAIAREWEDVFDVWVKGDVQAFVRNYLSDEALATAAVGATARTTTTTPKTPSKRKAVAGEGVLSALRKGSDGEVASKAGKRARTSVPGSTASAKSTPPARRRSSTVFKKGSHKSAGDVSQIVTPPATRPQRREGIRRASTTSSLSSCPHSDNATQAEDESVVALKPASRSDASTIASPALSSPNIEGESDSEGPKKASVEEDVFGPLSKVFYARRRRVI